MVAPLGLTFRLQAETEEVAAGVDLAADVVEAVGVDLAADVVVDLVEAVVVASVEAVGEDSVVAVAEVVAVVAAAEEALLQASLLPIKDLCKPTLARRSHSEQAND